MKVIPFVYVSVAILSACGERHDETLPPDIMSALEQAFAAEDAARAAAVFGRDAQILPQDRPAVRSQEIGRYLDEQMDPIILFDSTPEQSFARGDIGVEIGTYRYRDTRRGDDIEHGKYINVWRKEEGEWKLYRTMYNTDNPVRGLVTHQEGDTPAADTTR